MATDMSFVGRGCNPAMCSQQFGRRVSKTVATPWKQAGGGPAAAHFLCFAKESKQRKATQSRCPPLAGSQMGRLPVGWGNKLASLKQVSPQFPTDSRPIWQRLNAEFKSNFKSNVKSHSLCGELGTV